MMVFFSPFTFSPNKTIKTRLPWLNCSNDTAKYQYWVLEELLQTFLDEDITALEVGSPYGGAVEVMAKLLKNRGKAYGFDTFEGHPKDLADDPNSFEATCMDGWYKEDKLGIAGLSYDYQRAVLDLEGLSNAILVKGRINEDSFNAIDRIHFAMLDLDLIKPTITAYEAIKDKIVPQGYVFFHDALPPQHLPYINEFVYNKVIPSGLWEVIIEDSGALLTGLRKKG